MFRLIFRLRSLPNPMLRMIWPSSSIDGKIRIFVISVCMLVLFGVSVGSCGVSGRSTELDII